MVLIFTSGSVDQEESTERRQRRIKKDKDEEIRGISLSLRIQILKNGGSCLLFGTENKEV